MKIVLLLIGAAACGLELFDNWQESTRIERFISYARKPGARRQRIRGLELALQAIRNGGADRPGALR